MNDDDVEKSFRKYMNRTPNGALMTGSKRHYLSDLLEMEIVPVPLTMFDELHSMILELSNELKLATPAISRRNHYLTKIKKAQRILDNHELLFAVIDDEDLDNDNFDRVALHVLEYDISFDEFAVDGYGLSEEGWSV